MEITYRYPTLDCLVFGPDGDWKIVEGPPVEIALWPALEPVPGASDSDLPTADGPSAGDSQEQGWRYHVEWRSRDPDLLAADATAETWLGVLFAYLHLPDEDRATRKAKEAARRAARESAKQQAIEADEFDTKKTPKQYPAFPIEDVDPAIETIIFAFLKLVAYRVETWINEYLDRTAIALENAGQAALAEIRAGNRLSIKQISELDEELQAIDEQEKTLEMEKAAAFDEIKASIWEKKRAERVERIEVIIRGRASPEIASERPWYILQQATEALFDIRWRKAALERKRRLALLWLDAPKSQGKGGATIAEELFAEGLLKLVKIVPTLPSLGKRKEWGYEAPDYIAYYLTGAVDNAIYDYRDAADRFRGPPKDSIAPVLGRTKGNEYRRTIHIVRRNAPSANSAEHLYDGNTRYFVQCNRSGVVELEEQEYMQWAIDHVCRDNKDQALLWMKEEGIFTQQEMADILDLTIGEVRDRCDSMRKELEKLFGLSRRRNPLPVKEDAERQKERSKRASRKPEEQRRAQEYLAHWQAAKESDPHIVPDGRILVFPAIVAPSVTDLGEAG